MNQVWNERVNFYLDQLETATESIDLLLDEMRVSTAQGEPSDVENSTRELSAAIERLAELIQKRESLLLDSDAPEHGTTLVDKLFSTHRVDDARIARRCQKVAVTVENTHHRAMSLFVCQYHLATLSTDLVRILSGERTPPTYAKTQVSHRGGIFNKAG